MKALPHLACVTLISLWCLASCAAQSLGEAAHQQQEQKKSAASKPKHVITNEDISSLKPADSSAKPATKKASARPSASDSDSDANEDRPSAQEIQANIKEQRQKIREIEAQMKDIEKELEPWKTSDCTHVLHANTSINACDEVQRLNSEHETTKGQLAQEKKNLADMQEDARKMGYPNSVYDPN